MDWINPLRNTKQWLVRHPPKLQYYTKTLVHIYDTKWSPKTPPNSKLMNMLTRNHPTVSAYFTIASLMLSTM